MKGLGKGGQGTVRRDIMSSFDDVGISKLLSCVFVFLLITTVAHAGQGLTVSISLSQESCLVAEPVFIRVTLTNNSTKPITILGCRAGRGFAAALEIIDPDGRKGPPEIRGTRVGPRLKFNLAAGESIYRVWNSVNLFGECKPGAYKLKGVYYDEKISSRVVSLVVKEPGRAEDIKALQFLQNTALFKDISSSHERNQCLYGYVYWREKGSEELGGKTICQTLLEKYPTSTYAKYAQHYFAGSYARVFYRSHKAKYFEKGVREHQKLIDNYPAFALTDDAQLAIAKLHYEKGDLESARKELQKLTDNYPDSDSIQEAKELLKKIKQTSKDPRT